MKYFLCRPGMPKSKNFSRMFRNALIWIDFVSVPQLKARHSGDDDQQDNSNEENVNGVEQMMLAVNSIPAYVKRASLMLVIAPVVPHKQASVECEYRTWMDRGWCRLEAVAGSLLASTKYVVLVESSTRATLISTSLMVWRDSVGCGSFACCSQNHILDVDGVPTPIPCDRVKVSHILLATFRNKLDEYAKRKNLSRYI